MIKTVIQNENSKANKEWVYTGDVVTWQAAGRFTLASDETDSYLAERRIKVDGDSVGSVYGRITSSTYSSSTNVNVNWDSTSPANETLTVWLHSVTEKGFPRGSQTFESGDWTPTVTASTAGDLSVAYTIRVGRYVRMGDYVHVECSITFTPTFSTSSGDVLITGLPYGKAGFEGVTSADGYAVMPVVTTNAVYTTASAPFGSAAEQVNMLLEPGIDYFRMVSSDPAGGSYTAMDFDNVFTTGTLTTVIFSGGYMLV